MPDQPPRRARVEKRDQRRHRGDEDASHRGDLLAAPPDQAKKLYEDFSEALRRLGVNVATGVFQAMMSVESVNEGPVTILLDSDKTF